MATDKYQDAAIVCERLTKRYGGKTAVDGINWVVPRGSVTGLVGPNGAGKTTTLKMLVGLVHPSEGQARVLGLDVVRDSLAIRARTGYMPEDDALPRWMTPRQAMEFSRRLYPTWSDQVARETLDLFGLPLGTPVAKMSKGMKRQLALALAVAQRPELLLLDEPTSGLDPERRRDFLNVILKSVAADGVTVVMSSHQLHEVERVADRVAFMRDGRIVRESDLDSLKESSRRIRVVFQGEPPADLARWEGVQRVEVDGRLHVLHVTGDVHALVARLQTFNPFVVEVIEQNLEDLYFETAEREESRS
ncbi:MAG: ABC transporter ATP-binding protein [Limnochordales bacterium]|nr:ABC transporter ATP-binding protein [Bacillota bacterium]